MVGAGCVHSITAPFSVDDLHIMVSVLVERIKPDAIVETSWSTPREHPRTGTTAGRNVACKGAYWCCGNLWRLQMRVLSVFVYDGGITGVSACVIQGQEQR